MNRISRFRFSFAKPNLFQISLIVLLLGTSLTSCQKQSFPQSGTNESGLLLPRPVLQMPEGARIAEAIAKDIQSTGQQAYVTQVMRLFALDPFRSSQMGMMTGWVVQLTPEKLPQPNVHHEVSNPDYVFEIIESPTISDLQGNLYNLNFSKLVQKALRAANVGFLNYVNNKRVHSAYEVFSIYSDNKAVANKSQRWSQEDFAYDARKATFESVSNACKPFNTLMENDSRGYHFEAAAACVGLSLEGLDSAKLRAQKRTLSKVVHPDVTRAAGVSDAESTALTKAMNEAFDILVQAIENRIL